MVNDLPSQNKKAFTVLELIIVIIIVMVLVGLAIPKFFALVEKTRATEAMLAFTQIRSAIERCYVMGGLNGYCKCTMDPGPGVWQSLALSNPSTTSGAHFDYAFGMCSMTGYVLTATRNTYEGGNPSMGYLEMTFQDPTPGVTFRSSGIYTSITFTED